MSAAMRAALRRVPAAAGARAFASPASSPKLLVLGSGSNVMDLFFPVRKLPMPGDKQYYAAETCMTDAVVGGVTLNHLSWARALGECVSRAAAHPAVRRGSAGPAAARPLRGRGRNGGQAALRGGTDGGGARGMPQCVVGSHACPRR